MPELGKLEKRKWFSKQVAVQGRRRIGNGHREGFWHYLNSANAVVLGNDWHSGHKTSCDGLLRVIRRLINGNVTQLVSNPLCDDHPLTKSYGSNIGPAKLTHMKQHFERVNWKKITFFVCFSHWSQADAVAFPCISLGTSLGHRCSRSSHRRTHAKALHAMDGKKQKSKRQTKVW